MMFINYAPQTGITVSSSRYPGAYYGELCDVVEAYAWLDTEAVCCDLDGALATLKDGDWQTRFVDIPPAALEALYDAIRQATDNPDPSDPVLRSRTAPDA